MRNSSLMGTESLFLFFFFDLNFFIEKTLRPNLLLRSNNKNRKISMEASSMGGMKSVEEDKEVCFWFFFCCCWLGFLHAKKEDKEKEMEEIDPKVCFLSSFWLCWLVGCCFV